MTAIAVKTSTSGRTAAAHWGTMPYRGRKRGTRLRRPAIAEAPANHRMAIVLMSYAVPNTGPRYSCAKYASARPFACPPFWNSLWGIRSVVTRLDVMRNPLMISAALVSSRRVPRMRPAGLLGVSEGSPCTKGITATPVSKPDRPRASFGKTIRAIPIITKMFPCCWVSAAHQSVITTALLATCVNATATTTAFRTR